MTIRTTLAASLLLLATACSGGGGGAPAVSDADRAYGAEQHPKLLAELGGVYPGDEAAYVEAVGERVAAAAGLDGHCVFTLVNSNVVNAFAVPGCYIYVTRGLFAVMTSEAELAAVLGHELGHIVGAHSRRQGQRSIWRQLGVILVSFTGSETLTRLAGQAAQYFTLRYSRGQEYESDALGISYVGAAGYDPYAAADMLAALGRQERFMTETGGRDSARSIPEWARSHPLTGNRVERARSTAAATGLADDQLPENEAAYHAPVDGLLFGDDPAQGFVIGRRFAHPELGIVFEAPPGFTLTNSPQAILLEGPGGIRGEFGLGSIESAGIEAYAERLAQGVVGDAPAELIGAQREIVNGLPAAILELAIATDQGPVPVTIAAYAGGGNRAYHFVMVAPPRSDRAPLAPLIASFRLLAPEERASLRPRVIRTIVARPGDTPATLARNMADADPLALFLLLNGVTADAPLRPGQPVKIVTVR